MSDLKRAPNFSPTEKHHLIRIIASKYSKILEDKKTDRVSNIQKDKAWQDIEVDFNASSSFAYRSARSLKKCYENRKKELRKNIADEKRQIILTGGGPPPKFKKDTETDDILASIISEKTLAGLTNKFDDDYDARISIPINKQNVNQEDNDMYPNIAENNPVEINKKEGSGLKGNGQNIITDSSWKKYTAKQLQQPINAALDFTDKNNTTKANVEKAPNNEATPKSSSRRRPQSTVKAMTSSDVAKKYNILLDKRLSLVEEQLTHMRKENDLIIKKRKLEIEILEFDLKKRQN